MSIPDMQPSTHNYATDSVQAQQDAHEKANSSLIPPLQMTRASAQHREASSIGLQHRRT